MPEQNPLRDCKDSVAWQKSMALAVEIYVLTRAFPVEERYGLVSQLRRAAVSIPSNIAEGKGRATHGELLHFVGIARGSAMEVATQLQLSITLGFVAVTAVLKAQELNTEVVRMLNATMTTLRTRAAAKRRPSSV